MRDIYSKRTKEQTDNLIYDEISEKLQVQIVRTWQKFFKQLDKEKEAEEIWTKINEIICDEHGKHTLLEDDIRQFYESYRCQHYFEHLDSLKECFDVIEIIFRAIQKIPEIIPRRYHFTPEEAVNELNERFKENDFGYEFTEGKIIRIDNKLLHKDVVVKTLSLTHNTLFENSNEEYLSALDHLKNNRNKEALNDSLKSFESTMKIICKYLGWKYNESDTAKKLIQICFDKELIPNYLQSHFGALRTTLESGIPTIRNKRSGHGQGPKKVVVPDSLASYSIYMTGVCINYLIELHKEKMPSS